MYMLFPKPIYVLFYSTTSSGILPCNCKAKVTSHVSSKQLLLFAFRIVFMTVWIDGLITFMSSSHNSQSYIFTFSFTFAMRVANIPISWAWRSISVGKIKEHRTQIQTLVKIQNFKSRLSPACSNVLREGWAVSAFKI